MDSQTAAAATKLSPVSPSASGSLPIRAPISADELDPPIVAASDGSAEEDGFETASDPDEDHAAMPIAKVTGDDDVEVFEDGLPADAEEVVVEGEGGGGDGLSAAARVALTEGLGGEGEVEENSGGGVDGQKEAETAAWEESSGGGTDGAVRVEGGVEKDGAELEPVEVKAEKDEVVVVDSKPVEAEEDGAGVKELKPVEASDAIKAEKDREGAEDSKPVTDAVAVKKDGASIGSEPEEVVDSKPMVAVDDIEAEKDCEGVEESKPVAALKDVAVRKDGATAGSELEGAAERKPVEASDDVDAEKGGEAVEELKAEVGLKEVVESDGASIVSGHEGVVELKPVEASVVVESENNGEGVEEDSKQVVNLEAAVGVKDGDSNNYELEGLMESKPIEASGATEIKTDDGAGASLEREADLKAVELQPPYAAEGNKVEADGRAHPEQDQDEVIAPASNILEMESNSKGDASVVASEEGLGGDSALESKDKLDADGDAEKDEGLNGTSRSVESKVGEALPNSEEGNEMTAEQTSVSLNVNLKEAGQESAAENAASNSPQEIEAHPVLGQSSENKEREEENPSAVLVSDQEVKPDIFAANDENVSQDEAEEEEEEEGLLADSPARVAILESTEAAKQIIRELEEGSSGRSSNSGFRSSQDYPRNIDGQIVTDSDEEMDTDEEGEGKELFDSAALAALLKAATGASPDGSSDTARVFSVDRPAGLGSSAVSLKPGPARSTRPSLFAPTDLAVVGEPENDMDEEEKKLHEKVEQIRVKFLRLVHRLGHSPEDTVAAQVIYRLSLAEGIRRGRQLNRAVSLENTKKKALQLEAEGKDDLDFSCNILVLGKTGVGKSATINSIFGEEKSRTNAFEPTTNSVREISGVVDGVKIRVLDTPGLRASVMEQASNRKILSTIKKYTKRCPPDIVLYVDRLDTQTRDFNDLPLLRSITSTLGSSIWFNAIVALTHAASAPPDGPNGSPLSYEVLIAQRSHVVQHSIRQAAGDMRLMNPVALVENHPSCRRNREGQRVLPNGLSWRPQMLLLCYSSKILSEANTLLKLQDPSPGKLFGFRLRSPPLPFLLSSLLQSRQHPKLANDQGVENADSDIDLDDFSDSDQEEEDDDYDSLPPFKPLRKAQIAKLAKEQRRAYFEEYDYRVKLLQKKQWKEEIRRLKEMKKRGKIARDEFAYGDTAEDYDQDGAPAAVPVPLPDMVLPPSFDGDNPAYRYRFLEPTSQLLTRPVLDTHGWDHDCGYDGVSIEESLAIASRFPASVAVQITKDKKEFNIHLDSSISAKHGENVSSLAGFDIQSVGRQLAYILRSEAKFKNLKKNKTTAGISVTFLGETVATGLKIEDQITIGKRVSLVASTGAVRAQGDTAYGANLEARLRDKDYPIGQVLSTLGLSLMRWRGDLALGANLQSQFSLGRNSKVAVRAGLNNKLSGQITVKTSSSEQLQIALVGILPVAVSIFKSIWPGEAYFVH